MNIIFDLHGVLFEYVGQELFPLKEGIAILDACKENKFNLFFCTNFSQLQVHQLKQTYPDIFKGVSACVTVTDSGFKKPHPGMFQYILTTHNLEPHETFFIDDQLDNVLAAQRLGILGIHAQPLDEVRRILTEYKKL